MSVNPIYDGPTYDSPGGESFKQLLGNGSVPCTPVSVDGPRYFGMPSGPPSLPPPRKNSVCNGAPPLSTAACADVYTEMKPMSLSTPGSCVISCPPNIPPALYEAMGGDPLYDTSK